MEGMKSRKRNSTGKPIRRSHTRRSTQEDSPINTAQARREIVNALQLHRSSSSSSSSSCSYGVVGESSFSTQYCSSSLLESLPLPQSTWSTTAPSVLATPPPPLMEALEFEWAENLASSHTWWLGFLKTLDGNNSEVSKYPFEEEDNVMGMGHYKGFGQCPNGSKLGDPPSLDANDHHHSSSLDEWLTIPTAEEDKGEML